MTRVTRNVPGDDLARRSHELLKQACELEVGARTAFVERQCAGDEALMRRVLALLRALRDSTDFLESPALGQTGETGDGRRSGTRAGGETASGGGAPGAAYGPDFGGERAQEIAGYRIVRLIGEGGMARVYEAMQRRPHRRVALKVMNRGLTHRSAVQRFLFETEVLARLRHPGIAQIHEAGSFDDGAGRSIPYFAMEYIPGARTITTYAAEEGLSVEARLALCAAACDAVQHGHQNGVIHRDLKPGNVLVDVSGHVKVIDFGIARSTDPDQAWITRHTEVGQLVGTLNYMSPEQCAGAVDLDVRTDVYALGMILYELMCGRLPHDLTRLPLPEAVRVVQREAPIRPSAVRPELRGDVEAIILKAIDKDPERRYRTAAAFAADLGRYLRRESIEARPPTLFYQLRLFARRRRSMVIALLCILLSLLTGIVLSTRYAYVASRELALRQQAEHDAVRQRDAAVWRAYVASVAAANAALRAGETRLGSRSLERAPQIHRNWEWRLLHEAIDRTAETVEAHSDMILAFDATADAALVATGGRDGVVQVWDAETRALKARTPAREGWIISVAFDPEGRRLAAGSNDGTVRLWDAETGQELRVLGRGGGDALGVAFLDDRRVGAAFENGRTLVWDAETGAELAPLPAQPGGIHGIVRDRQGDRLFTWNRRGALWIRGGDGAEVLHQLEMPASIYCAAVSPDGAVVAAAGAQGRLNLWDTASGQLLHALQTSDSVSTVRSLAFSPDGATLVSGQTDRVISFWSVAEGQEQLRRFRGHEETVSGLAFTADGHALISASWDRTMRVWILGGPDYVRLVRDLRGHRDDVITARFSPDASLLASCSSDGTVRLWEPELGEPLGVLRGHRRAVFALDFSPDGRWIATGSHDRTVRLWNARTGVEESVLEGHRGEIWSVDFSPDGTLLASGGADRTVRVWDLASGKAVATLTGHTHRVNCVQFSPDGSRVASVSRDNSLRLWDVATATEIYMRDDHRLDVYAVLFSADGRLLFTGSRDQSVRVWEAETGRCLHVLDGHGQNVTCLALSPTEDRLAAGSWYGEVVLWDLATMELIVTIKGHEEAIRSVQFASNGRWLATAAYDDTVKILDDAGRPARLALRRAAAARYAEAAPLVDRLLAEAGDVKEASRLLEAGDACDDGLLPWARKELLRRAVGGDEAEAAPAAP